MNYLAEAQPPSDMDGEHIDSGVTSFEVGRDPIFYGLRLVFQTDDPEREYIVRLNETAALELVTAIMVATLCWEKG